MMEKIKKEIAELLSGFAKLGKEEIYGLLEIPPDPNFGDISFPCFILSKSLKKTPEMLAKELKERIKLPRGSLIKEIKASGPYLNFFFDEGKFAKATIEKILKEKKKYGYRKRKNKAIVIEFPSPNTNKPLHLGHLRNMALGESLSRMLESQGYDVFRVNLNNDRGIHICKSMLAYKKWGNNRQPDKKGDHFVGDFYVIFEQKSKEDPNLQKEARKMLNKWERGDKEIRELWKKMNAWALKGFEQTYNRFGVKFDKTYFESEMYEKGKEIILNGLKNGIFHKGRDGAVFIDLGKDLGKKILLRADGTSVYITQDIYLAKLKYDEYKYEKSIYVVANEQDYHFKVLFKILEILGYEFAKKCYHLSYGMVYLPEGRMKSREGTVVDADSLINEMVEMAEKEIKSRNKLTEKESKELAEKIALASIKYFLLKFSPHKDFVFRPKESLSFEGNTGPYIQYSLVRANKILWKGKTSMRKHVDINYPFSKPEEKNLIKKLSQFPEIIKKGAENYAPNILAEYSFQLASLFSLFYEKCPVIQAKDEIRKARLLLLKAYSYVISSCLHLMGIEEVGRM